jgi:hypothetical protein
MLKLILISDYEKENNSEETEQHKNLRLCLVHDYSFDILISSFS